jgi:hypothetical protein
VACPERTLSVMPPIFICPGEKIEVYGQTNPRRHT